MDYSYALMDLTVYGRQEPQEDSPPAGRNDPPTCTTRGSTDAPSPSGRDSRLDAPTISPFGPDRPWRGSTSSATCMFDTGLSQ
jgi:hypothetical protein